MTDTDRTPFDSDAEVEGLATVIRTRARSHPESEEEWRAIERHAKEIVRIAGVVLRHKVSRRVFEDPEVGSEAADYPEGAVNADGYLRNDRSI